MTIEPGTRLGPYEIANALDKANRQGVIPRDLNPGNIMLTKSGVSQQETRF